MGKWGKQFICPVDSVEDYRPVYWIPGYIFLILNTRRNCTAIPAIGPWATPDNTLCDALPRAVNSKTGIQYQRLLILNSPDYVY